MLQGDAKWGAFAASEAFILPSHQENFGIAVVESLASAKPVLLSTQINIAPDIAAAHAGFVEPDTLEGTRNLLARWFSLSPAERSAMSDHAASMFHHCYNMANNTQQILEVFQPAGSPAPSAPQPLPNRLPEAR
jgi:glycosyltransferase involved in cell wall biosynthesis